MVNNSQGNVPFGSFTYKVDLGFHSGMSIREIRKANLRSVIKNVYAENQAELAAALDKQASQISRYFSDDPRHKRNISDATARKIEEVAGLEPGWMDKDHSQPTIVNRTGSADAQYVANMFDKLPPFMQAQVRLFVEMQCALLGANRDHFLRKIPKREQEFYRLVKSDYKALTKREGQKQ